MKYSVAIIGLGNIGMLYDSDMGSQYCLTHSKSFFNHPGFNLKMMIDVDEIKLRRAKKLYGKNKDILFLKNLNQSDYIPEVIVLSSSPRVNKLILEEYYEKDQVKVFFIEKPFDTIKEEKYLDTYNSKIAINYFRKFLNPYRKIKAAIDNGEFGKPLLINCIYSKGLKNNGSHMLDLILFFFEKSKVHNNSIKIISKKNDFTNDDLSIGFIIKLEFKKNIFPVVFQIADENKFSVFECDIVFENQRTKLNDFGFNIETYQIQKDRVFNDYKKLELSSIIKIKQEDFMLKVVDNLYEKMKDNDYSGLDLINEYRIQKIISSVIKKSKYE